MALPEIPLRPLAWIGSAKKDYLEFPPSLRSSFGYELHLAQAGEHPSAAKPLRGMGGGVLELTNDFDGDTFRAVYTVRFKEGCVCSARIQEEIEARDRDAETRYRIDRAAAQNGRCRACRAIWTGEEAMKSKLKVEWGSNNIFADLGFPDADERLLKAQIVAELYRLTRARKLTQVQTGKVLDISQPEVSRLFRGHFEEYSVERLMKFLTAFDRDVEIISRPRKGRAGKISFAPLAA